MSASIASSFNRFRMGNLRPQIEQHGLLHACTIRRASRQSQRRTSELGGFLIWGSQVQILPGSPTIPLTRWGLTERTNVLRVLILTRASGAHSDSRSARVLFQ